MIEANNPEINIDELMHKVKEEISKHQNCSHIVDVESNLEISQMNSIVSRIEALSAAAESRAHVRTKWPDNLNRFPFNASLKIQKLLLKILSFLFKDQREVNFNLINSLKESVALNQQLIAQVASLRSQLDEYASWRADLNGCISDINTRVLQLADRLNTIDDRVNSWMVGTNKHLDALGNRMQQMDQHFNSVDDLLSIKSNQSLPTFLEFTEESYMGLASSLSRIPVEEHYKYDKQDLFYYFFENIFYNSKVVKEKQKIYLNFINENVINLYPFLDVGCGRGEFLQNLKDKNIKVIGIDLNKLEIDNLRKSEFDVYESDIVTFLENSNARYSGISALQVVEHLNREYINKFLSLSFEKLVVDGVIIIETVNPHSLYALSNFYQDPTHVKPLPPEMLRFLLEWHGFREVKIVYSSLIPESGRIFREQRMNYQDYAVVGYKKL